MDDIRGQIVIPAGDEAFASRNQELPVGESLGRGLQGTDITAGTGFGQTHRTAPSTFIHF